MSFRSLRVTDDETAVGEIVLPRDHFEAALSAVDPASDRRTGQFDGPIPAGVSDDEENRPAVEPDT